MSSKSPLGNSAHKSSGPSNNGQTLSRSPSLDGGPKRIRKGRGFTERFAFARRYRTPSPDRSPPRSYRYGSRNIYQRNRDRYYDCVICSTSERIMQFLLYHSVSSCGLTGIQTTEVIPTVHHPDATEAHRGAGALQGLFSLLVAFARMCTCNKTLTCVCNPKVDVSLDFFGTCSESLFFCIRIDYLWCYCFQGANMNNVNAYGKISCQMMQVQDLESAKFIMHSRILVIVFFFTRCLHAELERSKKGYKKVNQSTRLPWKCEKAFLCSFLAFYLVCLLLRY